MRVVIAGGGTGGHLFPGVAVAEELRAQDPNATIVFVGTERGIEARVLPELAPQLDASVAYIDISGIKTVGLRGAVRGLARLPKAIWQSRQILRANGAEVAIGVGGYASGPVLIAARLLGLPTAVLEQNSIPGITNKVLGRVVDAVFISFADSGRFFPKGKIRLSGNPIRPSMLAALAQHTDQTPEPDIDNGPGDPGDPGGPGDTGGEPPRIFIFGGSQGAVAVNRLVAQALAILQDDGLELDIVHQTGEADLETTQHLYLSRGITADCRAFIHDMARQYRRADVIVSRAGATTVAELAIAGRAAILIPYPYAADNHQEHNARALVEAGAAQMFRQSELNPERLADHLRTLLQNPEVRARMGSAMKAFGRPHAAADVVAWCHKQASRPS